MFFGAETPDWGVAEGATIAWQPPRCPHPARRPADDLLTLPAISPAVVSSSFIRPRVSANLSAIVRAQFEHGPLKPGDVTGPHDALDAMNQALSAWISRIGGAFTRMNLSPVLLDGATVQSEMTSVYEAQDFVAESPLYLGLKSDDVYLLKVEAALPWLRAVHPDLPLTVMRTILAVSVRTAHIYLPDWFLEEFAMWYWDGDSALPDDEARELLQDRWGDESAAVEEYLPSVVKDLLCPEDVDPWRWSRGRHRRRRGLSRNALATLRPRLKGGARRVCTQLIAIADLLVGRQSRRNLFHQSVHAAPLYPPCFIAAGYHDAIGDLIDSHLNHGWESGEHTAYQLFAAFQHEPRKIRQQYADWALAFRLLSHLDRLLSLVTEFY